MWTFFDRIFCLLSGLVMSQVPRFIDTYTTRLSGHVAEAKRIVEQYTEIAEKFGYTLSGYIAYFRSLDIPELKIHADVMKGASLRLKYLTAGYNKLMAAEWYQVPSAFMSSYDNEVAQATWQQFTFGLTFTVQTIAWMGVGVLFAVIVMRLIAFSFRFLKLRFSKVR